MAPIRIGFIGLASNDASWSSVAHMPYLKQSKRYEIVAVLNSSEESSKAAIQFNKLPSSTKAFGDPEEFAKDPDIDFVVCSVRVDRHLPLVRPSLEAGKACYVEWPLGSNLAEAEELTRLAKAKGVRTVVGLQGRFSGVYNTVKYLIEYGRIGDVLSSTVVAAAGEGGATEKEAYWYFYDRKYGGNILTIQVAHSLDNMTYALGEIASFNALLTVALPEGRIVDERGDTIRTMTRDTHDQIMLHGPLANSPRKAPFSYNVRGGPAFKGGPALRWNIHGTKGELEITNPTLLAMDVVDIGAEIKVHDFGTGKVHIVDWSIDDEWERDLPPAAQNIARVYEAYATGQTEKLVDFEESVKRHRMIDEMEKSSEEGRKGNYLH